MTIFKLTALPQAPVTCITETQSMIAFQRSRPTKKEAKQYGIKHWKQFAVYGPGRMVKLYSSSEEDTNQDESDVSSSNVSLLFKLILHVLFFNLCRFSD